MTIAAIVLAAGASRRMGRPKPLLPIEGTTYIEQLKGKLAAAGMCPIVIVLGSGGPDIERRTNLEGTVVVHNPCWRDGMLSSVQAAVRYLDSAAPDAVATLLHPVDQPRVAEATLRAVATAWRAQAPAIAVATYQGRRGHPAVFRRDTWPELLSAPSGTGARAVVEAHGDDVLRVEVDDPWVLVDADTPEQHAVMLDGTLPSEN